MVDNSNLVQSLIAVESSVWMLCNIIVDSTRLDTTKSPIRQKTTRRPREVLDDVRMAGDGDGDDDRLYRYSMTDRRYNHEQSYRRQVIRLSNMN